MACILKTPDATRGLISFTSPEAKQLIKGDSLTWLQNKKKDWAYLLHHNWTPATHDSFFDASLCNHDDLTNSGPCVDMDCCNFSPSHYMASSEKSFDILFVTRAVKFKRVDVFFNVCKSLLRQKKDVKILLICSYATKDCFPKDIKQVYLASFTAEERKRFTCLFFDYDYPFPLGHQTLSHFYKASRVFVHTATAERHPRVCSYAWASLIPVVGYPALGTFLSQDFQQPPYFYPITNDNQYTEAILTALDTPINNQDILKEVSESKSINKFISRINNIKSCEDTQLSLENIWSRNLDFRLGRHCLISLGDNNLEISIEDLMTKSTLINPREVAKNDDPELYLTSST